MTHTYWSRGTLSITIDGPNGDGQRREMFAKPFALLGSHPQCDVVLDAPHVANRSLLIAATHRGLGGMVLSSTAKRAGRFFRIDHDRPVKIRSYRIGVELPVEVDVVESSAAAVDADCIWVITWKAGALRRYLQLPNHQTVLIGRRPPCHVLIDDDRLSSVHCCLYRHHDQLWAIDLCSSNGTWLSNTRIASEKIAAGRSIRIGRTRMHFLRLHTDEATDNLRSHVSRLIAENSTLEETRNRQEHQLTDLQRNADELERLLTTSATNHLSGLLALRLHQEEQARLCLQRDQQSARQLEEINRFESELAAEQSQRVDLERAKEALEAEVAAGLEQLGKERKQREVAAASRTDTEAQLTSAKVQFEELRVQRDGAQSRLMAMEMELAEADVELNYVRGRRDDAESQVVKLTSEIAEMSAELDDTRERRDAIAAQLRGVQLDIAEREQILRSAELDASRHEVELIGMKARLRREQQELRQIRERMVHQPRPEAALQEKHAVDEAAARQLETGHDGDEDTCLSSTDFAHILDEAIESQPAVDDR